MNTETNMKNEANPQEEAKKSTVENTNKEKCYITFSPKQVARVTNHSKNKMDIVTGEVMKIATVKLPSEGYRSHRFGKDANGIDRDKREAQINIVTSYIYRNEDKVTGRLKNYFSYLDPTREYSVYFKGKVVGKEADGKNKFDKPEKAILTGQQLSDMYRESRIIAKEKAEAKQLGMSPTKPIEAAAVDKTHQETAIDTNTQGAGDNKDVRAPKSVKDIAKAAKKEANKGKGAKPKAKAKAKSKKTAPVK